MCSGLILTCVFYQKNKVEGTIWKQLVMCLCTSSKGGKEDSYTFHTYLCSNKCWILLMYCICCSLPWQGLKAGTRKQKYDRISEKKVSTPIEVYVFTSAIVFIFLLLTLKHWMLKNRFCVETNRLSLFLTSVTAGLYGLMTNLITLTLRDFSATCSSEKVLSSYLNLTSCLLFRLIYFYKLLKHFFRLSVWLRIWLDSLKVSSNRFQLWF